MADAELRSLEEPGRAEIIALRDRHQALFRGPVERARRRAARHRHGGHRHDVHRRRDVVPQRRAARRRRGGRDLRRAGAAGDRAMSDGAALLLDRPSRGRRGADAEPARRSATRCRGRWWPTCCARFGELGADPAVRCAVLTGAPPAFCGGGDLAELRTADDRGLRGLLRAYRALALQIRDLPFPLIAAVNGAAVAGGFELMCLADMRVAADGAPSSSTGDANLGLPHDERAELAAAAPGRRRPGPLADDGRAAGVGRRGARDRVSSRRCARPARRWRTRSRWRRPSPPSRATASA